MCHNKPHHPAFLQLCTEKDFAYSPIIIVIFLFHIYNLIYGDMAPWQDVAQHGNHKNIKMYIIFSTQLKVIPYCKFVTYYV